MQTSPTPSIELSNPQAVSVPALLLSSAFLILRTPRLLALSLIPALSGLSAFILVAGGLIWNHKSVSGLVITVDRSWESFLSVIVVGVLALLLAAFAAILSANLIGALSLESLASQTLQISGVSPPETPLSIRTIIRALIETLLRVLLFSTLSLLFFALSFFPPLVLIPILGGAFLVGADLLDTSLTLLGYKLRTRLAIITRGWMVTLALGLIFGVVLVVPLVGALLIPLGVVTAARLVGRAAS